jgi:hypothetical protein
LLFARAFVERRTQRPGPTGWQAHSVRAVLAGVVRKKLGLTLQSDKTEGECVYRVIRTGEGAKPQAAWAPRRSSAATGPG